MRKQLVGFMLVGSLTALSFSFIQRPVRAADNTVTIDIILDDDGLPVFKQPNVTITQGQSITWKPADAGIKHHLLQDNDNNKPLTPVFNQDQNKPAETATHEFKTKGTVIYHCQIHPGTMKGTITVN
jgi:plastocyanin